MAIGNKTIDFRTEGIRFVNSNPTIDTGVKLQGDTTTAWVATTPSLLIVNNDIGAANAASGASTGTKMILVDSLWLRVTAAGAGLASLECAVIIDDINRFGSGGTDVSANSVSTDERNNPASIAKVYYGATAAAAHAARLVGKAILRGAIPVVNDQYMLDFGAEGTSMSASALGGTAIVAQTFKLPSFILGPGQSALIYLWAASMSTSPSAEFELVWLEA